MDVFCLSAGYIFPFLTIKHWKENGKFCTFRFLFWLFRRRSLTVVKFKSYSSYLKYAHSTLFIDCNIVCIFIRSCNMALLSAGEKKREEKRKIKATPKEKNENRGIEKEKTYINILKSFSWFIFSFVRIFEKTCHSIPWSPMV